jgi:polyisoprenoid-binding protein YceI
MDKKSSIVVIGAVVVALIGVIVYNLFLKAPEAASTTPATAVPVAASEGAITFNIVSGESEARFIINEVLNNAPFTVVGKTSNVSGQLAIDPNNPANSTVGTIQVNARDFATDSRMRDNTIKGRVLKTNENEYVTFTPTSISGLPSSGAVGQAYNFQIIGDLTIAGVSKSVTFDATVTAESEQRVVGSAKGSVLYADFGISIPSVPQVASVDDTVVLEIDFVATPAN